MLIHRRRFFGIMLSEREIPFSDISHTEVIIKKA